MRYKRVMFMHPVELSPGEVQSGFSAEKKDEFTGEWVPTGVIITLEASGMIRVDSGSSGRHRYVVEVPRENVKQATPYLDREILEAETKSIAKIPPAKGGR